MAGERLYNVDKTNSWKETNHGRTMSDGLRILIQKDLFKGKEILELGGGIANHTVLVLENDPKLLVSTEIDQERQKITKKVVNEHFDQEKPNCKYIIADWLAVDEGVFDVLMTNPPYFMSGKFNRRYFIDELILNSFKLLRPGGHLIFVQSSMADIDLTKNRMEENGYDFSIIHQMSYPWRDYYLKDPRFLKMCKDNPGSHFLKDGERWETLFVVMGHLKDFKTEFVH